MTKDKKKKTIQISVVEQDHDLQRKAKQLAKFHEKGHPVRVELRLKGRSQRHRIEDARKQAEKFLLLSEVNPAKITELKWAGTSLSCHVHA